MRVPYALTYGWNCLITPFSRRFEQVALEDWQSVKPWHGRRYDSRKQRFGCKACEAPKRGRGYAAMRGEISGALVCGSSRRIINRCASTQVLAICGSSLGGAERPIRLFKRLNAISIRQRAR